MSAVRLRIAMNLEAFYDDYDHDEAIQDVRTGIGTFPMMVKTFLTPLIKIMHNENHVLDYQPAPDNVESNYDQIVLSYLDEQPYETFYTTERYERLHVPISRMRQIVTAQLFWLFIKLYRTIQYVIRQELSTEVHHTRIMDIEEVEVDEREVDFIYPSYLYLVVLVEY